jgi:teichuronic acid biosynthesis glycosyltransferase TuaG
MPALAASLCGRTRRDDRQWIESLIATLISRSSREATMIETVSVIIPTWNRAGTIGQAISSALKQTHPPFEILVCDDGSTDNTEDIVRAFRNPKVVWLANKRAGRPAVPRNAGLRNCRGEWVAFLDSDDEWAENKLEVQLTMARKMNVKALCTNARLITPDLRDAGNLVKTAEGALTLDKLFFRNAVVCSSVLLHRSLINCTGGFPEDVSLIAYEDYALWLRVATQSEFYFIDENLVTYLEAPSSVRARGKNEILGRAYVFGSYIGWRLAKSGLQGTVRSACVATVALIWCSAKAIVKKRFMRLGVWS